MFVDDKFTMKVAEIVITQRWINDSFIIGHPINGVLHDSTTASIIDNFDTNEWTTVNASAVTTDSTTIVDGSSLKITPSDVGAQVAISRTF